MSSRGVFEAPFQVARPEKASMTLLSHIDVCPYSGALYLRDKGGKQTHAMARGELFHDCIERLINLGIESGEQMIPSEVGKDFAQALIEERVDLALPAHEQEAIRIAVWNWCSATVLDPACIVGVELMMELEIGDWTIRGKLDLCEIVNNEGIVTDWKTSLGLPTREAYEQGFQGQTYALLLAEGMPEGETVPLGKGLNGIHTKQVFPRHDPKRNEGRLIDRHAYYDRQQLFDFKRSLEANLAKLDHGLTTGKWAATDGSWCARCPAPASCPIPPHLRDVRIIGTDGDALEVAQSIAPRERELKADKAALKAWVDENGRVVVGDESWDFEITRSERADKDAIKALIEDAGQDESDFFKESPSTRFGKSKLKEAA